MIVEDLSVQRLKENNINIKTKYKVNDTIKERNTDNSKNEDIEKGIILEKQYYCNGQIMKKEYDFDSRIQYTFVFKNEEDKVVSCPNCGNLAKTKDFFDGCPYCRTPYNIEYLDKDLGGKYYYDRTVKGNFYIIKTLIVDIIVSFIVALVLILGNSRTFYFFDMIKVVIYTSFLGLVLFYIFYYLDAIILLPSVIQHKEKINKKQREFWARMNAWGFNKTTFYNNFNYELRCYYYGKENPSVIDFDIIDYNYFKEEKTDFDFFVNVNVDLRLMIFEGNKIVSKLENKTFKLKNMKKDGELVGGINIIKCRNCGASIDVANNECEYCRTKVNYFQEWIWVD